MGINITPAASPVIAADGSMEVALGQGTATGTPFQVPNSGNRNNRGRSIAVKIKGHALTTPVMSAFGRINRLDDEGWTPVLDDVTSNSAAINPPSNDDTICSTFVLGADYADLRIDSTVVSGTMDIYVSFGD